MGTVKVNEGGGGGRKFVNYRDERRMKQQMMTSELLSVGFTHTEMHRNCSHCSSSFVSPFGFLSACCLATRTPAMWLGCDSPGAATSWACRTHVIRIQTHVACICICVLQLHTEHTNRCFCLCLTGTLCSFYLLLYEKGLFFLTLPKVLSMMTGMLLGKMMCNQVENGSPSTILQFKMPPLDHIGMHKRKNQHFSTSTRNRLSHNVTSELQAAFAAAFYAHYVCDGLICTSDPGSIDGSVRK